MSLYVCDGCHSTVEQESIQDHTPCLKSPRPRPATDQEILDIESSLREKAKDAEREARFGAMQAEARALDEALQHDPWGGEIDPDGKMCGRKLECGSTCWRPKGHENTPEECLCSGDMDGPGTCPA